MFIEEQELNDWGIYPTDSNDMRKQKSISAYWLNNWVECMDEYTFPTVIYNNLEEIPDILPFAKCMCRYENKSPKDSDYWGPISTKSELVNLFYTSLRCKTNPGKYYCIREWIDLGSEYRCFWNNGLVAISSEENICPPIEQILKYIHKIQNKIKYTRCVFDLAHIKETNELVFIEYNSWETNSGAHRFNWSYDKEIFYCSTDTVVRWNGSEIKIPNEFVNKNKINTNYNKFEMDNMLYEFVELNCSANYLITDKYIYISNDVWLGRFDYNLKPLNWIGGIFRFSYIELCTDGCICIGNSYYYPDLRKKITKSKLIVKNTKNENKLNYRYGIPVKNKNTLEIEFVRMLDNCDLVI